MALNFRRHILKNGLRLIINRDTTTPLVSCNIVYNVGSRDEDPDCTGMAHLFEHFMFCGSKNIREYDRMLQKVGAINNAYTSQDITHYYIILPASNLETALWLESDRMLELAFQEEQLQIQKQVVMEEFKENYMNRPFSDLWMQFNGLVYQQHPYRWLPIGKELSHIEKVDMAMMKRFYYKFYRPNNAVIVISGNVVEEDVIKMVERWFGDIPSGEPFIKEYPQEPEQTAPRTKIITGEYPHDLILKGWKICDRRDPKFYAYDLFSDLLGSGRSSYLYQKFVIEDPIFTQIVCQISGTFDPGTFVIMAVPNDSVPTETAQEKLNDFIYNLDFENTLAYQLQKVKNRVESVLLNSEIKVEDRSSILAVTETFSTVEEFEHEKENYFNVTEKEIIELKNELLQEVRSCNLIYSKKM